MNQANGQRGSSPQDIWGGITHKQFLPPTPPLTPPHEFIAPPEAFANQQHFVNENHPRPREISRPSSPIMWEYTAPTWYRTSTPRRYEDPHQRDSFSFSEIFYSSNKEADLYDSGSATSEMEGDYDADEDDPLCPKSDIKKKKKLKKKAKKNSRKNTVEDVKSDLELLDLVEDIVG